LYRQKRILVGMFFSILRNLAEQPVAKVLEERVRRGQARDFLPRNHAPRPSPHLRSGL